MGFPSTPARSAEPGRNHLLIGALLSLLAAGLYAPTIGFDFAYDDGLHLSGEAAARLERPAELLYRPTPPGNLYRPLSALSHAAVHAVAGQRPGAHHLINTLLHGAVTALLFALLLRLTGRGVAVTAALLFALHPVHLETVTCVAYRTELLCAAMILGALLAATGPGRGRLAAVFLLTLGAVMSKESGVCLLLLLPLCAWGASRGGGAGAWPRRVLPALTAAAAAVALYLAIRFAVLGGLQPEGLSVPFVDNPIAHLPATERWLNGLKLLGDYWARVLWPHVPSADYSYAQLTAVTEWLAPGPLASLGLVALLPCAALLAWRRGHTTPLLFVLWFFLSFAVTANLLLPIGTIFGERLAYLPSVGGCGLVAWLISRVRRPALRLAAGGLVAMWAAVVVVAVLPSWRDNDTLFAWEHGRGTRSVKVLGNLGHNLGRKGKLARAERVLRRSVAIHPRHRASVFNLGLVLMERGARQEAETWFSRALDLDPGNFSAALYLGKLRFNRGAHREAAALFHQAASLRPKDPEALVALLTVRLAARDLAGARAARARLVRLAPTHAALPRLDRFISRLAAGR